MCVCVYFSNHNFYSEPEGLLCASNLYTVESSFFWLDDVDCKGDESGLLECAHGAIGKHDCTNKELAGARCEESGMYLLPRALAAVFSEKSPCETIDSIIILYQRGNVEYCLSSFCSALVCVLSVVYI